MGKDRGLEWGELSWDKLICEQQNYYITKPDQLEKMSELWRILGGKHLGR